MASKRIYLTRHAQGFHNVNDDYSIHDAEITPKGHQQSLDLHEATKDGLQQTAELIVSSPLIRPIQTMLIAFATLKSRIGDRVILLPEIQEINDLPSDTGSPRAVLEQHKDFAGVPGLDFSVIDESEERHGVAWTSKQGFFHPDNIPERAKWVRRWLRDREEQEIVVIAHGDVLEFITDGFFGTQEQPWANAEVRAYNFASEDDEDALLVPLGEVAKEGEQEGTSSDLK
ncbi:phosphoglycerate mutase-like protein [Leucosporidium creatinivorum]|uniref:Phosphoglycerate mutase-like protein n=1 Tax=Leucosporidium creatinivorum TaxID=106004 RepID=A0A1Y2EPU8_9BASI|nr:phosphoglycerate mutase-like protein [Leucosporidium creatinivorum]